MKWFVLWALGGTFAVIMALCLVLLLARGRIRRHHRVDHKVATGAPLTWMVDPRSPARLHRRLSRIGTIATTIAADHQPKRRLAKRGEETPIVAAADELKAQAVTADRHLARIAGLAPAARRVPLAELARRVSELEEAATRLAALSADSLTPRALAADNPEVSDVRGQLERLAAAQRELDALDADAGLRPATANPLTTADAGERPSVRPPSPVATTEPAGGDQAQAQG